MKHYLVCYDISNKRRLARIHKLLVEIGIPLQYSIFYLKADEALLDKTIKKLTEKIDEQEDDVRIYTLHNFNIDTWKKANVSKINQALLVV